MLPCTFPKFLEIWPPESAPRATAACVQKGSSGAHTHAHTPRGCGECPVIRLCFDLDTHREERTNDCAHAGGWSLYRGMYTKGIRSPVFRLIRPLTLAHTSHTRHTSPCRAVINRVDGGHRFSGATCHWSTPCCAAGDSACSLLQGGLSLIKLLHTVPRKAISTFF